MIQAERTTILIVDDDPTFLLMLRQFLEKEAYKVVSAVNGQEAIEAFNHNHPNCILMDAKMPVMNGFEACRSIRALPEGRDIPLIMVTAQESDDAVDQCYAAGASDYISKPLHWAVLRNRIHNLIEKNIADKRLKESEHRFNQIFNTTKDAFWLIDAADNELLYVNNSFEEIFSMKQEALWRNPLAWIDVVHPEDRVLVESLVKQYRRQRSEPLEKEFRILRPDGEIRWLDVHCFSVKDFKGTIIRRVGVASDITARKMSQDYFQVLIKSVKAVPWSLDLATGQFTYVGDQALQVLGITPDQMPDMDAWIALIHPEDRSQAVNYCSTQSAAGQAHEFEYRMLVNGQSIWIRESVAVTMGADGPISLSGFMFNITEAHLKQERLRKLSQAIEQAGESVIITDKHATIEYVNRAFTNITGYSATEVIGKNPRILKSGNQSKKYYQQLWSTISAGKTWHSSIIDRRKDGSQYPATMSIAPIFDDNGQITHYVGLQQDMTEQEMIEERFRQAQKMEALGTLVGGIAHDFNNLLAAMTGNLYIARRRVKHMPLVDEKLKTVEGLGFQASDMIKQLLTFARKGMVQMQPFGLTSFIKEISKLNTAAIPENIIFDMQLCDEELVVKGDATQLQQVLMNLLNNARDALIDTEAPVIVLSMDEFETNEAFRSRYPDIKSRLFAHLVVQDNGTGISDEHEDHIFEPFFTTKEVGLGTGLGLSMAYGAIRSHGGAMEVDSIPGSGTSFHIYLPLLEEKGIEPVADEHEKILSGQGELILLVDDNADVRETGKEVLTSLGYRVMEAADGLKAVEIFSAHQQKVSLIVMDVVMPRLGGVQAAERIKEIRADARIVFASGYDREEALTNEMPSGDYILLSKPYSVEVLSRTIREQLKK